MNSNNLTKEEKSFYSEKCKKENKTSVITRIGLWGPWMDKLDNLWSNHDAKNFSGSTKS